MNFKLATLALVCGTSAAFHVNTTPSRPATSLNKYRVSTASWKTGGGGGGPRGGGYFPGAGAISRAPSGNAEGSAIGTGYNPGAAAPSPEPASYSAPEPAAAPAGGMDYGGLPKAAPSNGYGFSSPWKN